MTNFKDLMAAAPARMDRETELRWDAEYCGKHPKPERPGEGVERALEDAAKAAAIASGVKHPPYHFMQAMPDGKSRMVGRWSLGTPYLQCWRKASAAREEYTRLYWPAIYAAKAIKEIRKHDKA